MESARPGDWEVVAKAFQNRGTGHDARGPRALGQRRLRRRPSGRLRRAQGSRRASAGHRAQRACAVRRAHRLRLPRRPGSRRGGVLPAAALRRAPAGDGAHPLRERGSLAPRLRARSARAYRYWAWLHKELVPFFYSLAYRMYEDPGQPVVKPGPMPDSLLIGDVIYAPIVTASVDTDGHRAAAGRVGRLLGLVECPVGRSRAIPSRSDASRSSSAGAPSSRCGSSATTRATARRSRGAR